MAEEANDVKEAEVVDTSTTESSPEETTTSNDDIKGFDEESGFEPSEEPPEQSDAVESEQETQEEVTEETQEQPQEAGEDSPANKRIRELVARAKEAEERAQQYEQYLQQLQSQPQQPGEAQPQTIEQYQDTINPDTGEYYTAAEAKVALLEQQLQGMQAERQQQEYQRQIEASRSTLTQDVEKTLQEFPMFDANSDQYDAALAEKAQTVLEANLITDNSGAVVGSRVSPYQIYKSFADVYKSGTTSGQVKGQKATSQMLQNADITGRASGATAKTDPYLEAFESEL